jgi:hypothetical protein
MPLPRAGIEYVILADAVEALNGKLYLMGGGWSTISTPDLSRPLGLAIACGVEVPWSETDDDHGVSLRIDDTDGNTIVPALTIQFKTGRPATLERGAVTHVPFAIRAEIQFPAAGEYVVIARVDDRSEGERRLSFFVKGQNVGT